MEIFPAIALGIIIGTSSADALARLPFFTHFSTSCSMVEMPPITRASVYAETIRIHVFTADDPTVFNSFPGSHQRILVCDIQSLGSSPIAKIEILDFRSQRHLVPFQIESG